MFDPRTADDWREEFFSQHGRMPMLVERVEWNTHRWRVGPRRDALQALQALAERRGARLTDARMPDAAIRQLADARADMMARELDGMGTTTTDAAMAWLSARVVELEARPFAPGATLAASMERARCRLWWRRQLRRAVVRRREAEGITRGEIRAHRQVYCTDDTVTRRMLRQRECRAMLEAVQIESIGGDTITLAQAADASTSNKAIRRGELMTRIRGCEEWAEAAGMQGVFTTNTAPSRFHPQLMAGGANPRYAGLADAGPRQAQLWLRGTWDRCRAAMHRAGLRVFGFRVAEPHHDGCPHWHMLLWCEPERLQELSDLMRAAWLADDGQEPGAAEHRCKIKPLDKGGAAAYVAKYVAKNIDDAGAVGAEGHRDTDQAGQTDWVGTGKAQRVEAWAAAWGIRQFQALGQPPVTVWRELRRVEAQAVRGAHADVQRAHAAVQRTDYRRACWRAYMDAQGGAMQGMHYRIRLERTDDAPELGRYGEPMAARIVGLHHVERPGELIQSSRKAWKPRGAWTEAQRAAPVVQWLGDGLRGPSAVACGEAARPWTRVNNCTGQRRGAADLMRSGLVGLQIEDWKRGRMASTKEPPCPSRAASPPSSPPNWPQS
ncbi:MAG: replication endonuclease [Burkholderiaceae bacterium]|nr:replication endonuclease [Burkholderiaceae bacterium]